ncbi:hypothetical protein CTHBC1_2685 [Acetivibrio thermocellus BC1]|nr:hypothetical protein CTHBC1_2685 [Acetivibrio thermocellus BC1]
MRKRRVEFSKKMFVGVAISTALIVIFSLVIVWKTGDTSPLTYIIPAMFAELATATGFYYKKAEAENKIKLKRLYGKNTAEDDEN